MKIISSSLFWTIALVPGLLSFHGDLATNSVGTRGTPASGELHQSRHEFFVATTGSDDSDGSRQQPFATLNRARTAVRYALSSTAKPIGSVTVWIRAGVYELKESFTLERQDSGSGEDRRVIYSGYDNEQVRLIGGRILSGDASNPISDSQILDRLPTAEAKRSVVQFDLDRAGITNLGELQQLGHGQSVEPAPLEAFVDREPLTLARYPNSGSMLIGPVIDSGSVPRHGDYSERGATFEYTDDRHERWANVEDVWLQGTFKWGYADDMIPIKSIDPKTKRVKLASPHMYGVDTGQPYRQYYALNLLEELDAPGEYYVDRSRALLLVWPPEKLAVTTPDDSAAPFELGVSVVTEPLISLREASFVTIRNITLEFGRGIGIYIEGGERNEIDGATIRNMGNIGIMTGKGAVKTVPGITHEDYEGLPKSGVIGSLISHRYHNTSWNRNSGKGHAVRNCDVYNTGSGGILIGGGDRSTLQPGDAIAENNRVWNNQRRNKFLWAGINVDGVGNRIANNEVFDSDFQAIMVHGNEHIFEYNHIHHIGMDSDDTSPWYTGRDPSGRGHVVRYNYFHDIGRKDRMGMGVYLDDGTSGVQIYGNVFDRVASYGTVYSNAGSDNNITNNIFLNGFGPALHIKSMWFTWAIPNIPGYWNEGGIFPKRLKEMINITAAPYSERYPELVDFFDLTADEQALSASNGRPVYQGMLPRRNVFARNLIVNYDEVLRLDHPTIEIDVHDNWTMRGDPGFVDMNAQNYALTDSAEVFKQIPGFERVPWERIGVQRE